MNSIDYIHDSELFRACGPAWLRHRSHTRLQQWGLWRAGIGGSNPPTPTNKQLIAEGIKRAKGRGVAVQHLLVKSISCLPIATRYHIADAEIRFHSSLLVCDVRYVVLDQNSVLIGLRRKRANKRRVSDSVWGSGSDFPATIRVQVGSRDRIRGILDRGHPTNEARKPQRFD